MHSTVIVLYTQQFSRPITFKAPAEGTSYSNHGRDDIGRIKLFDVTGDVFQLYRSYYRITKVPRISYVIIKNMQGVSYT